ncbi:general transcription factor II-I repeat domain-containing protein 2B-like [Siphateles boraxobius]|uniref:general transcription factor II-I repeat domain-containing protein 2B-like n=1 Tax=Siphateles boraxobius TaxID=180520 RepID=UPI004063BA07
MEMMEREPEREPGPSRKKRHVSKKKRQFQDKWTNDYFVEPHGSDKVVCLICKKVIAMRKDFNIKRHYDTKHKNYDKFSGKERTSKLEQLKRGYTAQQSLFTNLVKTGEAVTQASYVVAQEIAKWSKPFSDGEFVRDCMLKVADILCPEQKTKFRDVSLSNETVTRQIEDLANDLKEQLGKRVEGLGKGAFSIALDESTDISDTAQLLIFIRTVTENFDIGEELLSVESMKDTSKGVDICDAVCHSLDAYKVNLASMVGVTTDGAPAMVGSRAGAVSLLSEKVVNNGGHGKLISTLFDNVKAFQRKLELLQGQLRKGDLTHFPACKSLVDDTDTDGSQVLSHLRSEKNHTLIKKLREEFNHRFSDFRDHEKAFNLFQNPFSCVPEEEPAEMQFEFIDLQKSSEARAEYRDKNLIEFYKGLSPSTCPALRQHAVRMVSLFGSTYICEKTLSTMAINKSKLRSRLTDGHLHAVLRITTTEMEPDIRGIVANRKKHHKSHGYVDQFRLAQILLTETRAEPELNQS